MPKLKPEHISPTDEEEAAIQQQIAEDPDDFELDDDWFGTGSARHRSYAPPRGSTPARARQAEGADQGEGHRTGSTPNIVAHFRSTGRGWQTRLNEALRKSVNRPLAELQIVPIRLALVRPLALIFMLLLAASVGMSLTAAARLDRFPGDLPLARWVQSISLPLFDELMRGRVGGRVVGPGFGYHGMPGHGPVHLRPQVRREACSWPSWLWPQASTGPSSA